MIEKPHKEPKKRKPLKNIGKWTKGWLAFRRQWIKNHPPDWDGSYICGICGSKVHLEGMELDHIRKRSTHPELRFDENNVRPVHKFCNNARL